MYRRFLVVVVPLIWLTSLMVSAEGLAQDSGNRPRVVASFNILADVARRVAGDAADVTSLMPMNTDPHGFMPTPQDLVALAEADAVLIVGAGFEAGLIETIENAGENVNIVVASQCVEILPFGVGADAPEPHDGRDAAAHEPARGLAALCAAHHAEIAALNNGETPERASVEPLGTLYAIECGGGHEEGAEGGEAHEAGSCDPHVWTDPRNAMLWALTVRDTLIALDPANAERYSANAAAYLEALDALADEMAAMVQTLPVEKRALVTDHEIFGYFANTFGFRIVGLVIPSLSTMAEPSAAEVAALIDAIRRENVPAIFVNATISPRLAERIAAETGATVHTLYTHSVTGADGPAPTYIDLMRYDTRTIVEALGGAAQ